MGFARSGTVFPVSVVVGAAVPAAVCRWGLCSRCPGVGKFLSGVYLSSFTQSPEENRGLHNMQFGFNLFIYRAAAELGSS